MTYYLNKMNLTYLQYLVSFNNLILDDRKLQNKKFLIKYLHSHYTKNENKKLFIKFD